MSQLQRLAVHPTQIHQTQVHLTPEQWHYLRRVLRLQAGDRVLILDGQGQQWLAALTATEAIATLLTAQPLPTELPVPVTLLMALPKTGMDDVVRQVTELGVTEIVPILSHRSLLQPSAQKLDRWRRIAQEAAEQCERPIVPTIRSPLGWAEALLDWHAPSEAQSGQASDGAYFFCAARGPHPHLLQCLQQSPPSAVVIAIGAEGGWTEPEQEQAIAAGYQPVSLGVRILRAVTAPVVAVGLVASVFEAMPKGPTNG